MSAFRSMLAAIGDCFLSLHVAERMPVWEMVMSLQVLEKLLARAAVKRVVRRIREYILVIV